MEENKMEIVFKRAEAEQRFRGFFPKLIQEFEKSKKGYREKSLPL